MPESPVSRSLLVFFRLLMGWTFLYAGLSQIAGPSFSAANFLAHAKTLPAVFAWFASPEILPITNFLVKWAHALIGLSLVSGLMVRGSGLAAIVLLGIYYVAELEFRYVDGPINVLIDYRLAYIGVLVYLIAARAGHACGLDGWVGRQPLFQRYRPN
jgi:thiosulfate dehydrogenase (quinone) large subunit